jgi:predicted dinucleotide-utilizing enzyme
LRAWPASSSAANTCSAPQQQQQQQHIRRTGAATTQMERLRACATVTAKIVHKVSTAIRSWDTLTSLSLEAVQAHHKAADQQRHMS